jgi:hypothetical protein
LVRNATGYAARDEAEGRDMTDPGHQLHEEHLTAEEDDGSAEFQPEDGGAASPPLGEPGPVERG